MNSAKRRRSGCHQAYRVMCCGTRSPLAKIAADQDAPVKRIIALPCTTLAGVQALATALAIRKHELLKDGHARDIGKVITSSMVKRLLTLHDPDATCCWCAPSCASEAAFTAIYADDRDDDDESNDAAPIRGFLTAWNQEAFADALSILLSKQDLRLELGQANRKRVEQCYSQKRMLG